MNSCCPKGDWTVTRSGILVLAFIATMTALLPVAATAAGTCAVAPLKTRGIIGASDAQMLCDRLWVALETSGKVKCIPRDAVPDVLKLDMFARLRECDSIACAVEIGQIVGAEFVVVGGLDNSNNVWSISLRLVETASGKEVRYANLQAAGTLENVYRYAMATLVEQLVGVSQDRVEVKVQAGADDVAEVRAPASSVEIEKQQDLPAGTLKRVHLGGGIAIQMVWIPPGEFFMGTPPEERQGRLPETRHKVQLRRGFWLGNREITQAQWQNITDQVPSMFKAAGLDAPVENVNYSDCLDFCRRMNAKFPGNDFRLPTEAEWEYACRAGTTTAVYTGPLVVVGEDYSPTLERIAWYFRNSKVSYFGGYPVSYWEGDEYLYFRAGPHLTGQLHCNPWGLFDILGNVWEWCQDWYDSYPNDKTVDPKGPAEGTLRIIRGGGWGNAPGECRAAARLATDPGRRSGMIGFRLAASRLR